LESDSFNSPKLLSGRSLSVKNNLQKKSVENKMEVLSAREGKIDEGRK